MSAVIGSTQLCKGNYAACTNINTGDSGYRTILGTGAVAALDEVFNKIQNAHPGDAMANLRTFGADIVGDVLTYMATLPTN